jgi:hypothetical protein
MQPAGRFEEEKIWRSSALITKDKRNGLPLFLPSAA